MRFGTLLVPTGSYPWRHSEEDTFLAPELPFDREQFERVVLLPQLRRGTKATVDAGVEIEESYAASFETMRPSDFARLALRTTLVLEDLLKRGTKILGIQPLKELLVFAGQVEHARSWFVDYASASDIDPSATIVCSYWWLPCTTGIGLSKRKFPGLRVVTRAHGFDLYEHRRDSHYIPCRARGAQVLDALFPVSDCGTEYARATLRPVPAICETARLGVSDPAIITKPSSDRTLRVVSCSGIRPVKRLELLCEGLRTAAQQRPHARFEWTHIGNGDLTPLLNQAASLPPNAKATFVPYVDQPSLFSFYEANPVDVFANVSSSEGVPVAIMEAIACHIPVVATSVGGNPEIVTHENGVLLSANPHPDEIARALFQWCDTDTTSLRLGARRMWQTRYDAQANHRAFAKRLRAVLAS